MIEALKALSPQNLPTPAQEEWKYTNLPRAVPQGLKAALPEEKVIHRTSGQNGGEAVELVWTGKDGVLHNPQLSIVLEDNAELTLIERQTGEGAYWKNMVTDIALGKNAKLHHFRIQDDAIEAVQTNLVHITLERDAVYDGFSLNIGAKLSRHELHAVLNGPNAECTFNGINMFGDKQHGDTTILIEHAAPHCSARRVSG